MPICTAEYQLNRVDIIILLFHLCNFHPKIDISLYLIQRETCHTFSHFFYFVIPMLDSSQEFHAK